MKQIMRADESSHIEHSLSLHFLSNSGPAVVMLSQAVAQGTRQWVTQPRNEMWLGRAAHVDTQAKQSIPTWGSHLLPSCHSLMCSCFLLMKYDFLCSTPRCISKLSRGWITNFDDSNGGKNAPAFSPSPKWDH